MKKLSKKNHLSFENNKTNEAPASREGRLTQEIIMILLSKSNTHELNHLKQKNKHYEPKRVSMANQSLHPITDYFQRTPPTNLRKRKKHPGPCRAKQFARVGPPVTAPGGLGEGG